MAVMSFLAGLSPELETVKSQILSGSKISSLHDTFTRNNRNGNRGGGTGNRNRDVDSRSQESGGIVCYYCHEPGHTKRFCRKLLNKSQRDEFAQFSEYQESLKSTTSLITAIAKLADGSTSCVLDSETINPTPSISLSNDLTTKRIIGKGRESRRLYYLDTQVPGSIACSSVLTPFESYMIQNGILHQSSCIDTPFQNGVAKRKNRHLLEVARALLFHTKVPKQFWVDAVSIACFLINRMPSSVFHSDIPYTIIFPSKSLFPIEPKIFGSTCFVRDVRSQVFRKREEDDLLVYTVTHSVSNTNILAPDPAPAWPPIVHVYSRRPEAQTTCPLLVPSLSDPVSTNHHPSLHLPIALHKGYAQTYGVDYSDTYSPVAKLTSVRLFISMAATYDWPLHQLDIKNALLHGDLQEEVYMEQPPEFVAQGEYGKVYHLRKSLYGLKQNPHAWFGKFSETIQEFGMKKSKCDHSVFYKQSKAGIILLVVYVDDIVITGSDTARKLGAKPCNAPMTPNLQLTKKDGELFEDPEKYRRLVGKLDYLTVTRPDIAYSVSVVSQFMSAPTINYWAALEQILYANWAGSKSDRRSTTGYCVFIGGNLVSWKIWMYQLLSEVGPKSFLPTKLWCDNQAALHIASNPVFHERTKHIEIDYHFIREKIQQKFIATGYVKTKDQLGDIFTKALNGPRVDYIRSKLGMINIYAPA
ncbi:Cysteine-rich RLK (RECEPTOR-like protein kinase) 8 [Theobroma cacao]|uniref:Cysteine-rich RLK (RECEPTOR-like protein kinase) 8 n=1 Tax=Theobroma cacao TaxID=3641 RepID=A0A061DJK1_THECC|nr:Cysteine-rich RLK (RECEPTOR-like protein kinase) 8 [Theobroma cacao]